MRFFTRWLYFVPLALAGFVARYFDNFIHSIAASALEMLRQTKLHRTIWNPQFFRLGRMSMPIKKT
jgi:hypothetical protein